MNIFIALSVPVLDSKAIVNSLKSLQHHPPTIPYLLDPQNSHRECHATPVSELNGAFLSIQNTSVA